MKIINISEKPGIMVLSGSAKGKKWSEENNLPNTNEEILVEVDENIKLIAISFYQGILESFYGKRDTMWIKENVKFKNLKYQNEFERSIR